jgi:SRSO17 transposase
LRLYLHETWANDATRRDKAGVPDGIAFQTKPRIALDQIRQAIDDGVPKGIVLADAGYGNDTAFRTGLTQAGLVYAVGVQGSTAVWARGTEPLPKKKWSGRGRPTKRLQRDETMKPIAAKALAQSLAKTSWQVVTWREGTKGELTSRFAARRVRPSHRDTLRAEPHAEEWLLIEWPEDEKQPTKYWLSTLPAETSIAMLVDTAKLRWRIERDFQDLKQEIGLDHYEGRGWRGFHHHAALSIAAYGFLVAERSPIPPSAIVIEALDRKITPKAKGWRPRGAAAA